MRPCALVVDGGAALPEDLSSGLAVVPVRITIGDTEFVDDGGAPHYHAFYERLRSGEVPHTSTPSPGEYLDAFRRVEAAHIVCITIPAKWSGMHDSARLAAQMLEQEPAAPPVTVLETESAAVGLALTARLAASMCAEGAAPDAVIDGVRRASAAVRMYGSLATLTYVARSGRVPSLLAGISNTLHIRPVFRLHGAEASRVALARTTSGALDALQRVAADQLGGTPQWLVVFHADAPAEAADLGERLGAVTQVERCETVALSPIAGAYTGPGAFGFGALPVPAPPA